MRDSSGVPRTLEVVAVVKGVARAQGAIDDFAKHLTKDEKKKGIFFCWEYTSRLIGRNIEEGELKGAMIRHWPTKARILPRVRKRHRPRGPRVL